MTFTFMHLADAFIQSDLQCIQAIHLYCEYVCSLGIEPTTFVLLTQCSNHWASVIYNNVKAAVLFQKVHIYTFQVQIIFVKYVSLRYQ